MDQDFNSLNSLASILVGLVFYVISIAPLFKLAKKLNTPHAWFAFLPILNGILYFWMGAMSAWWILLPVVIPFGYLIFPLLGLASPILAVIFGFLGFASLLIVVIGPTVRIVKRLHLSPWYAILWLVPFLNLIFCFYLAFRKETQAPLTPEELKMGKVMSSTPETATMPEPATTPEPATMPEPATTPETATMPEPATTPEPATMPEPVTMPEPTTTPEPATMPEPVTMPEPTTTATPSPVGTSSVAPTPNPETPEPKGPTVPTPTAPIPPASSESTGTSSDGSEQFKE